MQNSGTALRRAIASGAAMIGFAGVLGIGATANASITNGDFSAGLSGWTTAGLVFTNRGDIPASFAPTTDPLGVPGTPDSVSGQAEGGASVEEVAALLGTTSEAINGIGVSPSYGAVITQTFSATSGDVLSFKWNFVSLDSGSADFGFVYLNGPGVDTLAALADTGDLTSTPDYFSGTYAETGMFTFTSDALAGGTYRIGVGVFNSDNLNQVPSYLLVDDFALPEPGRLTLTAFGLAAVVSLRRFARRRSHERTVAGPRSPVQGGHRGSVGGTG